MIEVIAINKPAKGGSRSVFMIEVIEINKPSISPIFIAIRLYISSCAHVFTFKFEHNENFYLCFVIVVK